MKAPSVLLGILAALALSLHGAPNTLSEVPFTIGPRAFKEGDAIIIRQVLATSPDLDVGDRVIVRGRYTLQSQPAGSIGLSVTQTQSRERTRVSPESNMQISRGSGDFEVAIEVQHVGCLHLTFSTPPPQKKSVGTIYFGTPEQVERVRRMDLSSFVR